MIIERAKGRNAVHKKLLPVCLQRQKDGKEQLLCQLEIGNNEMKELNRGAADVKNEKMRYKTRTR